MGVGREGCWGGRVRRCDWDGGQPAFGRAASLVGTGRFRGPLQEDVKGFDVVALR